jgi:hypothetical protein
MRKITIALQHANLPPIDVTIESHGSNQYTFVHKGFEISMIMESGCVSVVIGTVVADMITAVEFGVSAAEALDVALRPEYAAAIEA